MQLQILGFQDHFIFLPVFLIANENIWVADLINSRGEWNEQLISSIFCPNDRDIILKVIESRSRSELTFGSIFLLKLKNTETIKIQGNEFYF